MRYTPADGGRPLLASTWVVVYGGRLSDRYWMRRLLFLALLVAGPAILLVGVLATPGMVVGQAPWPTPPPAPSGRLSKVVPRPLVTPVSPAGKPGSFSVVLDPFYPGDVPRVPPLRTVDLPADGVLIQVSAGAFWETVQLVYEPLGEASLPAPLKGVTLLRAFRLGVFKADGKSPAEAPGRAVRLQLSLSEGEVAAAGRKEWLVAFRYNPGRQQWEPLVTSVSADANTLELRLLEFGAVALVADPPPVALGGVGGGGG
ncbi:MAG: hypothetical protein HYY00_08790 [Chloroflexi bacterium]|nr:hypothetical protein [Chloroflexota bacterium]